MRLPLKSAVMLDRVGCAVTLCGVLGNVVFVIW